MDKDELLVNAIDEVIEGLETMISGLEDLRDLLEDDHTKTSDSVRGANG